MKWITNLILFIGLVLLCSPLYSYVGEEKAPEDALQVLTLPDAEKRIELEREKLEEGRKKTEEAGNILKDPETKKKEVFLGPAPASEWPAK